MSLRVPQCERLNTVAAGIIVFHLTFSFSTPSLCNSTSLLPCHSLSSLSLLLFESSASLAHFPALVAPSSLCVRVLRWAAGCQACVLSSRGLAPGAVEHAWGWANVALPYHPLPLLTSVPFCCHFSHSSSSVLYFPFHLACISPSLSLPVSCENDG